MRKQTLSIAAVLWFLGGAIPCVRSADVDPGEVKWRVAERAKNDDLADKMKKDMKLSPDQDIVVRRALEDKTQRTSALRQEFRTRLQELTTETEAKITASMSDDQKKQYAALKEKIERQALEESKRQQGNEKEKGEGGEGHGFGGHQGMGGGHGGGY